MSNIVPFDFNKVLAGAAEFPGVKIEREEFLQKIFLADLIVNGNTNCAD